MIFLTTKTKRDTDFGEEAMGMELGAVGKGINKIQIYYTKFTKS